MIEERADERGATADVGELCVDAFGQPFTFLQGASRIACALGVTSDQFIGIEVGCVAGSVEPHIFADAVGRITSVTNPLGAQSSSVYDALNRLTSSTDPNGSQIQFGYDPNGNRTSHTDANTHATAYTFDALAG